MGRANKGACEGKRCVLKRRQKKWMMFGISEESDGEDKGAISRKIESGA